MGKPLYYDWHGRLQILAVDDDTVNLMVIESVLKPLGWIIVPAIDGAEAYAAVDGSDTWPDLVLLDYNLEVGDSGETVLAQLRSRFGSSGPPIVMCTAMSASAPELERCLASGAADILLKPYERSRVVDVVNKYCPGKATAREAPQAPSPPPARAAAAPPAPTPLPSEGVEAFCAGLGLEYIGKKLKEQGLTLADVKGIDDAGLRKAGVVVKGQRDKILDAAKAL